ncbi:hypothetical protein TNCV_4096431 [Trichonephila clavipes]|nr:hypothetical protein TNCV_4096431 [Trichonephila clavipes]
MTKKSSQVSAFENYILWRIFVFPEWRQMALLVIQLVCGLVVKAPRWFRTTDMARLLENWSRLEVRAVIRFLWAKNAFASAMSRQHVANCVTIFNQADRMSKATI